VAATPSPALEPEEPHPENVHVIAELSGVPAHGTDLFLCLTQVITAKARLDGKGVYHHGLLNVYQRNFQIPKIFQIDDTVAAHVSHQTGFAQKFQNGLPILRIDDLKHFF
jgi:hypothetical protein